MNLHELEDSYDSCEPQSWGIDIAIGGAVLLVALLVWGAAWM